ncbi:hypothetical protein BO91_00770, partial [Candidatus Synechococcus spongiarum LMB bulk10E]
RPLPAGVGVAFPLPKSLLHPAQAVAAAGMFKGLWALQHAALVAEAGKTGGTKIGSIAISVRSP